MPLKEFGINLRPLLKKYWILSAILALLTAFMIPVGESFRQYDDLRLIRENAGSAVLQTVLYGLLFFVVIMAAFVVMEWLGNNRFISTDRETSSFFLNHRFIFWGILFAVIALIFVMFNPGILMGDTVAQVKESFGIRTAYAQMPIEYLYEDSALTGMHPVLSTLFVKFCMLTGYYVAGSYSSGLALVVLFQIALITYGISRMFYALAMVRVRDSLLVIYLILLFINPVCMNYIYLLTKDIIFLGFLIVFAVELFIFISGKEKKRDRLLITVSALGVSAFRGEGAYMTAVTLAAVLILFLVTGKSKVLKKKTAGFAALAAGLIIVHILFAQVAFPLLHVTPGAKSFQAAIPIQQVSRYLIVKGDMLTEEEYDSIDAVMETDVLYDVFDPKDADPAKKCFNINAGDKEFSEFMHTWTGIVLRDPWFAVKTWLNTKYEYFSMNSGQTGIYRLYRSAERMDTINDSGVASGHDFNIHYTDTFASARTALETVIQSYSTIPVLRWVTIPAVYTLFLFLVLFYFIKNRRGSGIVIMTPLLFAFFITNMFTATNGHYFRYMVPVVVLLPFVLLAGNKPVQAPED